MEYQSDEVVVVVGIQGTGKTTWAKWLSLKVANELDEPIFAIDPNGDMTELPGDHVPHDYEDGLMLLQKAFEEGNKVLLIDEADLYFRQSTAPLQGITYQIAHLGRHRGLFRIFVVRRAADLHKDVYSQATHIVSFRQFYNNDIKRLIEVMGEAALQAKDLPDYNYIIYDTRTHEVVRGSPIHYVPPKRKRRWFKWF